MSRQVSWNRQLGLAIALFALGTLAYWLEYKHRPEKEATEEQAKRVFHLKDHPIESIQLVNENQTVSFLCTDFSAKLCKPGDNSKWEIAEPLKVRGDDSQINGLVSTLNTLNPNETIDLKDETADKKATLLKEYGLDPDARKSDRKVIIQTSDGGTVLYLGAAHPIGDHIFGIVEHFPLGQKPSGKVDESKVYLIPSYFKAQLEHDLTHWRDKKILSIATHDIKAFQYEGPKAKISADKKEGQWVLHSTGEDIPGDMENIDSLLNSATFLTAKGFASEQKNSEQAKNIIKGLKPALILTLNKDQGTAKELPAPLTLTLYSKPAAPSKKPSPTPSPSKVYATVSQMDPLYEVEPNTIERMTKSVKDLRLSKLITAMDRFSIKRLEFSGTSIGTLPLILTQKDGKWVDSLDQAAVADEKIQDFFEKISGNRIQDFLTGSSIPTGETQGIKVSLGDDKDPHKREFEFWENNGILYARDLKSSRKEVFKIDPQVKGSLPWKRDFFKPAAPQAVSTPIKS